MSKEIEEGLNLSLDFTKLKKVAACSEDVIPAIAQCADTGDVLIVGYVNKLALETAVKEGMATFWSTSRNELWIKGKNMLTCYVGEDEDPFEEGWFKNGDLVRLD